MNNPDFNSDENDFPAELPQPARRALANAGIRSLEQLSKMNQADLKKLHGIGPNALSLLAQAMAEKGLYFKEDNPEYKARE